MKPTYRKSWGGNLLIWTDMTLVPPSRSYDGFSEWSFGWMQIYISSPERRSNYNCESHKMSATKIPNECFWHEKWPVWGYVGTI